MKNQLLSATDFVENVKNTVYIYRKLWRENTTALIHAPQSVDKTAKALEIAAEASASGRKIVYINAANGYKITKFLENARVCDPFDPEDVATCMRNLRAFHEQKLTVAHTFDLFGQIQFYESLWQGARSVYKDYNKTKEQVWSLKAYIECHAEQHVLAHIDAIPDNFLFIKDDNENDTICLIDWEYAGMQDPHVDIAMFCIYSLYDKAHVDQLIHAYFPEGCSRETRVKIYCYIAACGLLWSNWCEYKRMFGVDFGEYSLRQYRYAKDYYKIVQKEWMVNS